MIKNRTGTGSFSESHQTYSTGVFATAKHATNREGRYTIVTLWSAISLEEGLMCALQRLASCGIGQHDWRI